jgi:signal recognition particle receptor subunit beta
MRSVKIVVTGPVRAGTTSLIRSVSEIAVLSTERRISKGTQLATEAVVAMDFGRVTVSDDLVLYMFGTPGEENDSLVGGPFSDGLIGIVVTVDATKPSSIQNATPIIEFLERHSGAPYVIAANRMKDPTPGELTSLRRSLRVPDDVPVVPCDAVVRASVKQVLVALLDRILQTMP